MNLKSIIRALHEKNKYESEMRTRNLLATIRHRTACATDSYRNQRTDSNGTIRRTDWSLSCQEFFFLTKFERNRSELGRAVGM
jgi:hypothetical protein